MTAELDTFGLAKRSKIPMNDFGEIDEKTGIEEAVAFIWLSLLSF